jgi:hypothetical protein
LDLIAVKGKSTPTRIFTCGRELSAQDKQTYAKALDFYRHARFAEGLSAFDSIAGFGPARKMAARCRHATLSGVPNSFRDGVWHFDEK